MTRKRFNKLIKAEMIQMVNILSKVHPSYRYANKVLYRLNIHANDPDKIWPDISYAELYRLYTKFGNMSIKGELNAVFGE